MSSRRKTLLGSEIPHFDEEEVDDVAEKRRRLSSKTNSSFKDSPLIINFEIHFYFYQVHLSDPSASAKIQRKNRVIQEK